MKKLIMILCLTLIGSIGTLQAMERETLVGSGEDVDHGGFGGVTLKGGKMGGDYQIMVGGKGAWLIDHQLYAGGSGYGVTRSLNVNDNEYQVGLGGFMIGYFFLPSKLVHFGMDVTIGGGGISETYSSDESTDHHHNGDALFYAEPTLYASLNLASHAKLNAGVTYRYVLGSDTAGLSDEDLRGFNAEVSIVFGKF